MANDNPTHKLKVGDLAKIAGVSPSTVSKVINGRPGISDETRRQVEQVLREHDYSRPLVSTKLSPTIELVVEYIAHNGTMELIKHASHWAQQAGLAITVTQTNHGEATESCFRGIIDRNPQGVIMQQMGGLTTQAKSLLKSRSIPVVIIDPIDTVDSDVMSVSIDNWTAGYQAGKHLLSLGHRRIAGGRRTYRPASRAIADSPPLCNRPGWICRSPISNRATTFPPKQAMKQPAGCWNSPTDPPRFSAATTCRR